MELWDLYDRDRRIIGAHTRGEPLPTGGYHLVVHVWIQNRAGEYLISQRAADRPSYPLWWETTGGSVLQGETSLQGALRETKEEVGVDLDPVRGKLLFSRRREELHDFLDVWLFDYDGPADLQNATTAEVAQARWMTPQEIRALDDRGLFVPTLAYFLEKLRVTA